LKPFIYDFKRAFVRKATLITLVLFMVAGVGLAYIVAERMITTNPGVLYTGLIVSKLNLSSSKLELAVGIYDANMEPAEMKLDVSLEVDKLVEKAQGVYTHEKILEINLGTYTVQGSSRITIDVPEDVTQYIRSLNESSYEYWIMLWTNASISVRGINTGGVSMGQRLSRLDNETYGICEGLGGGGFGGSVGIDQVCSVLHDEKDRLHLILASPSETPVDLYYDIKPINESATESRPYYGVYYRVSFVDPSTVNISDLGYLGTISEAMEIYVFTIPFSQELQGKPLNVLLTLVSNNTVKGAVSIEYYYEESASPSGVARSLVIGGTGVSLFSQFFPIVMLYLGYVLVAKPRSQGALEFILARPVTRAELFLTRYVAGVLVGLVAPAVFMAALYVGLNIVLGIDIGLDIAVLIYLGLAASLIAFYTLCYYIAVELKGGGYLAVSITLYMLFLIGFQIIGVLVAFMLGHTGSPEDYLRLTAMINYFNPMGLADLVPTLIQANLNIYPKAVLDVVKPEYIAAAFTAWVAVPFTLGLARFRKKNLAA